MVVAAILCFVIIMFVIVLYTKTVNSRNSIPYVEPHDNDILDERFRKTWMIETTLSYTIGLPISGVIWFYTLVAISKLSVVTLSNVYYCHGGVGEFATAALLMSCYTLGVLRYLTILVVTRNNAVDYNRYMPSDYRFYCLIYQHRKNIMLNNHLAALVLIAATVLVVLGLNNHVVFCDDGFVKGARKYDYCQVVCIQYIENEVAVNGNQIKPYYVIIFNDGYSLHTRNEYAMSCEQINEIAERAKLCICTSG